MFSSEFSKNLTKTRGILNSVKHWRTPFWLNAPTQYLTDDDNDLVSENDNENDDE